MCTGVEVKIARALFNIRQRDLARESGLAGYQLSRFESGNYQPTKQELKRILGAFSRLLKRRIEEIGAR